MQTFLCSVGCFVSLRILLFGQQGIGARTLYRQTKWDKRGKTSYSERFSNILRQCCSRLVVFFQLIGNYMGAFWQFIHDYNARIYARLALNATTA